MYNEVKIELIGIGILVLLTIAYFLIGLRLYKGTFTQKIKNYHLLHFRFERDTTFLSDESTKSMHIGSGSLTSHGYMRVANPKKWVFLYHPCTLSGIEMSTYAKMFYDLGYSVVSIDIRAHGENAEHTNMFGIKEDKDVYAWVHHITRNYGNDVRIYLFGCSLGANIHLLTATEDDIPKQIKGVIADSPYVNTYEFFKRYYKTHGLFYRFKVRAYRFVTDNLTCIDLKKDLDFEDVYHNARVPLLIIYGSKERYVSKKEQKRILEAFPKANVAIIEGGKDCESYLLNQDAYLKEIKAFMK